MRRVNLSEVVDHRIHVKSVEVEDGSLVVIFKYLDEYDPELHWFTTRSRVLLESIEEASDLSTCVVRRATSKNDRVYYYIDTPYSEVDSIDWVNEVQNG